MNSNIRIAATLFPRDMVCLRNICVGTLHKGDIDGIIIIIVILKGEPSEMSNFIDFRLAPRCKSDRHSCWDFTQRRLVIPYRRFGKAYMLSLNVCMELPIYAT